MPKNEIPALLVPEGHLTCTKCKETKPEDDFYNNRTHKRGKTFWCKVCTNYQNNFVQKELKAKWAATAYQNLKRDNYPKLLWKQAKHRAEHEYGCDFNIEVSDVVIPLTCPYLGIALDGSDKTHLPSLDRIDNSKGYVKGNVQVISFKANAMKNSASIKELITFAKGVLALHSKEVNGCAN